MSCRSCPFVPGALAVVRCCLSENHAGHGIKPPPSPAPGALQVDAMNAARPLPDSPAGAHYFCANAACALHIPDGFDRDCGNWVELSNGCIVGRTRVDGRIYCDPCASQLLRQVPHELGG